MIPWPLYTFIAIELLVISYGDLRTKKIPNLWPILNMLLYVVLLLLFPQYYSFAWEVFVISFAFLFVGFILFLFKIMGAGDTKFLFTFFLLIPLSLQKIFFTHLLFATVIIGATFFLYNLLKNAKRLWRALLSSDLQGVKSCFGTKFSYAPVILFAWMWMGWTIKASF